MLKIFGVTAALGSAIVLALPAAAAGNNCGPRDRIISHLESKYGEARSGSGLGSETAIVEVWTSPKSGTWTILLTQADGTSCIMAAGEEWQDVPLNAMMAGEPA